MTEADEDNRKSGKAFLRQKNLCLSSTGDCYNKRKLGQLILKNTIIIL